MSRTYNEQYFNTIEELQANPLPYDETVYKLIKFESDQRVKTYPFYYLSYDMWRMDILGINDDRHIRELIENLYRRGKAMNDLEQEFIDKADREENQALIRLTRKLKNSQNLLKAIDDYIHKDNNNINQDTRLALINIKSDLKCDIHGLKELIAKI